MLRILSPLRPLAAHFHRAFRASRILYQVKEIKSHGNKHALIVPVVYRMLRELGSLNWMSIPLSPERYEICIKSLETGLIKLRFFKNQFPTMNFDEQIEACEKMKRKLMAFAPLECVRQDLTDQELGLLVNQVKATLVQLNTLHSINVQQLKEKLFDYGLLEFVDVSGEPTKRWNAVEFFRGNCEYLGSESLSDISIDSTAVSLTQRGEALIGLTKRLRK